MDAILNVQASPSLLIIMTTDNSTPIELPPFLDVVREVTDEIDYDRFQMSLESWEFPKKDKSNLFMQF